jgi:hypothetical protein
MPSAARSHRSAHRRALHARRRRNRRRFALGLCALVTGVAVVSGAWGADTDVLSSGHDDATRPQTVHRTAPKPLPGGPVGGALLIADRGNDRILLVNPAHKIFWHFRLHVTYAAVCI